MMPYELPFTHDPLTESMLAEWGRWAKYRSRPPGSCLSLESRYRSPQVWYATPPRMPDPDIRVVLRVERALLDMPRHPWRTVLVGLHAYHADRYQIMRICRIPGREWQTCVSEAMLMLGNRLHGA